MMKEKYTLAMIADIHLGVMNSERQKQELESCFFHDLDKMDELDAIIILGDLYDKKIYLNDRTTSVAIWFYNRIIDIARRKHSKIRIIYGTKSHEADQYNLIDQIPLYDVDISIIHTVQEETLFEGVNVLYLPEEHMYSKLDYYEHFLYNDENIEKYHYIFGHGIIDGIMKIPDKKEDSKKLHVPRFTVGELMNVSCGEIYFGHYHVHSSYDARNFIGYVGSFNRWIFGEEETKGYMVSTYKPKKKKFSNKFIENTMADKYHTIYYEYDSGIYEDEENLLKEFKKIESLIDNDVYQKIRLMISIPENLENTEFYITAFKEKFKFNNHVKIEFKNGYIEKHRMVDKETADDVYEKYGFITNRNLEMEDITSRFIEEKQHVKIPKERVRKYMDAKTLNDIL